MMHRQPVGTPCRAGRTGPQPPAAFTAADAAPSPRLRNETDAPHIPYAPYAPYAPIRVSAP